MELPLCGENNLAEISFTDMNELESPAPISNDRVSEPRYESKIMRINNAASGDITIEVKNDLGIEIELINMYNSLFAPYQRVVDHDGLPFHAGLAELDGKGILIAGAGDTGKSTCCKRLPEYWQVLCDDETLLVRDGLGIL